MSSAQIPVARPDLAGNEALYVADAIRSSWISSTGPYVDRFEREFASWCGGKAAVSVANGTVALHLAMVALGVGPGDEVIVPSLTYVATANAVRYVGATPVFVDVDASTWCIDPTAVESAITPRTRGVIAVHLYGHPADMDALNKIAARHGLWVVEDAAEAHGASYRGRPVGALGTIGTFSFYGNKILTSGEGGALVVNDRDLEAKLRLYRGQGVDPARRYFFPVIGYNYRLTNVACAILCAQLERASELIEGRRRVIAEYETRLAGVPWIGLQPSAPWVVRAPWLMCLTVDAEEAGLGRDDVMAALERSDIQSRPFFYPIHRLPPYASSSDLDLPNSDWLATAGMNLPTWATMPVEDVDRVARAVVGAAAA